MTRACRTIVAFLITVGIGFTGTARAVRAQNFAPFIMPEQRELRVREPSQLPPARYPVIPPPPTVSRPQPPDAPLRTMSLDDAIRTALANAEVIRVLTGITAVSTGQTIYDPAIQNTNIDQRNARFDPQLRVTNSYNRREVPGAAFIDPADPLGGSTISGIRTDDVDTSVGVSKTNVLGGTAQLNINTNSLRRQPGLFPLNPEDRSSIDLQYTQPLLQGGGVAANMVPIVIARIDTERSYFQFKDSVQELVRSVIDGYWSLVAARVELWAREQQVAQAQEALELASANRRTGRGTLADEAQARSALANFRVSLVTARASVLNQEAALRNVLGIPPSEPTQLLPVTQPTTDRIDPAWEVLVALAEQQRPDIVELKLILEADQQLLIQANNNARPRLDATGLYRWNGLEGEMPLGGTIESPGGAFTDWTLAVNFSVPLGLRQERAALRQTELLIARDRANLEQGLHSAVHELAARIRELDQFYEQYLAFKEAREAALLNLQQQQARFREGLAIFLNVLQALTDWGNAVSAEAQALGLYNSALANLERETGTILETHGVRFIEERYGSLGPLGRFHPPVPYPAALPPGPPANRYPSGTRPAEEFFELEDQALRGRDNRRQPLPRPEPID